jgi:hypothetical protein
MNGITVACSEDYDPIRFGSRGDKPIVNRWEVRMTEMTLWRNTGMSLILALVVVPSAQGLADTGAPQQDPRQTVTIKGSTHPELIPEHIVWLFFFNNFSRLARLDATTDTFNEDRVKSMAKYELRLTIAETLTFLQVADRAVRDYELLMQRAAEEPDEASKNGRFTEAASAIIAARDDLAYKLPRKSFESVKRRAMLSARGISVDLPISR